MSAEDLPLPVTSSTEPAWAFEARTCYRDVMQAMQQGGIPCAVGGAFAFHHHTGIWRTTKDLDLILPAASVPQALARLASAGFKTHVKDPVWLAKAMRGDSFVDLITGVGNASLQVDAGWMERAIPDEILGIPCRILAAEELLTSKMFVARRERFDGADVVHLIRACGKRLDWDRVLQLLDTHWELLLWSLTLFAYVYPGRTDLVPQELWAGLTSRFLNCVSHPHPETPSRGSLVDPLMFAIDVNEWGERDLYREYCEAHPCLLKPTGPLGGESPE
ncbi:MAG TPA: hypothetical protein VHU89_01665 [Acidobacteriaceae bacterium]|jgi:hypothetical protein|nr:hypothetical protein [Acidobacteriaceae bacterium]